ncbi:MAG: hypothetical protein ACPG41_06765 [Lacinutrix venerupis]
MNLKREFQKFTKTEKTNNKTCICKIFLKILLFLIAGFSLSAQNITVSGKVQDSLKTPLDYANILAVPESDSEILKNTK